MKEIVEKLLEKKETIATMESCTGGALANQFTSIPGVSEIFHFGAVTYSNEYKIKMGVPRDIITTYGVYSKETAKAMAKAISNFTGSIYGIGVTGKLNIEDPANPEGNNQTVYFSIYNRKTEEYFTKELQVTHQKREENKKQVLVEIENELRRIL